MKKSTMVFALALTTVFSSFAQTTTWMLDASHTNIKFNVQHMVITEVTGFFKKFEGKVISKDDNFENAQIEFTADASSIFTDNEKRDGHLQGDDFFNAAKFPKITFMGKSFKKIGDKTYKLVGDLTMRDVTKQVEFIVTYGGIASAWGQTKAGFKLRGKINRYDYGLKWNSLTEAGGMTVGDIVEVDCNIELVKQK